MEASGDLDKARAVANVSRSVFFGWLQKDEVFRQRFDDYRLVLAADIENEAVKRVLNPSAMKGSDALASTLLKGLKPQRYADKERGDNNLQVIYVSGLRANPRQGVQELDPGTDTPALTAGSSTVAEHASEGPKQEQPAV